MNITAESIVKSVYMCYMKKW